LTVEECCGTKQTLTYIAIPDAYTPAIGDSMYMDIGEGAQCYSIVEEPIVFGTPVTTVISYYPGNICTNCTAVNTCPSPTPTPSISISPTPSVTKTPSVTPSLLLIQQEVTNCSTSATYLVSFTVVGSIPTGPVTYLSFFPGGDVPNGCYTISSGEPPFGPSDGVVSSIGDNSASCIVCTGKPVPSSSPSPSLTATPTRTISITPSPTRTPSLTPTKSPTPTPSPSTVVYTLNLTTLTGADLCAKGELRIKKNGVTVGLYDKNQGSTTVTPSVSSVTFVSTDTMILEAFSQGGGGGGCFTSDTIVRGYYGGSLVVTASEGGTNPNTYSIPNANATISAQFLAVN